MELNIEYNPRNDGYCCFFEHNGKGYYADVCELKYDLMSECMIFAAQGQKVTSWTELYCARGVRVTPEGLRRCIEEFIGGLAK